MHFNQLCPLLGLQRVEIIAKVSTRPKKPQQMWSPDVNLKFLGQSFMDGRSRGRGTAAPGTRAWIITDFQQFLKENNTVATFWWKFLSQKNLIFMWRFYGSPFANLLWWAYTIGHKYQLVFINTSAIRLTLKSIRIATVSPERRPGCLDEWWEHTCRTTLIKM